jgi:hypothetical protein
MAANTFLSIMVMKATPNNIGTRTIRTFKKLNPVDDIDLEIGNIYKTYILKVYHITESYYI